MSHSIFRGIDPGTWVDQGVCGQTDPETFFPEAGFSPKPAKAICAHCPVIFECLEYALANDESGVWGGTSETERRAIRRERRIA